MTVMLRFSSFHLVRNPELIERLKSEMAAAAIPKEGHLTRKHIQQLQFLKCCLNESGLPRSALLWHHSRR